MVPNGWKLICLGDIADTTMGYAFKSKDFVKSGIPLIRMGNLYQNKLDLDRSPIFLPSEFSAEYERFLLKSGDLVMSMTGTMGKRDYGFTVQIPKGTPDSLLNQRVMKFDTKANSDLEYLKYLLRSELFLTRLYAFPGGTKQANLSAKQVSEMSALLPPLPEQRKIAKILSTWDKAIATTEKLIETSKQQKKALMQQLLTGKKRLVNPETGKAFEGDWEEVKLGDISYITTGSSNREDSSLDAKYTFFDRSEDIRTSSRYLFDAEAVIVAGEGQDFVPKHFEGKFDLHQRTYAIMNFENSFGRFLYYYIGYYRHYFLAQAVGSTVKSLRLPMFQKMPINLPIMGEQRRIASVLNAADKEIEVLETKLTHFKQEKKALMQQLLTGKRRVKVDEVA